MTIIVTFDNFAGCEKTAENFDVFTGEDMRAATLAALADHGLIESSVPDAIAVHSGKAYITEHDGDRFWITLICNYLGDQFDWGYGATNEEALAQALPAPDEV